MSTSVASSAAPVSRRRLWLLFALVVVVVSALGIGALIATRDSSSPRKSTLPIGGASPSGQGNLISPPRTLTNFSFPGAQGTTVNLSDLRGKAVLLFFGYTHCPDFCPTTLVEFKGVKRELGADAAQVAFVFISVDSDSDTSEIVAQYAKNFDPAFIGLRGDQATLQRIGPEYDLYYKKREVGGATGYLIDHTAITYLIDQGGQLRIIFPYGTPETAMASDIRSLLTQR